MTTRSKEWVEGNDGSDDTDDTDETDSFFCFKLSATGAPVVGEARI